MLYLIFIIKYPPIYNICSKLLLCTLSRFTIVVNYDSDSQWTTLLDKFRETPKITKEIEAALNKLKNQTINNIISAKELGEITGYTSEEFFKFAKQADLSGDVLQQYKDYMAGASSSTSKFSATLKTTAANMVIMLAVNLVIQGITKIWDKYVNRVEKARERTDELFDEFKQMDDTQIKTTE
ncbi:hypothetical protein AALB16_15865 [Lachnospiraceae bacterium 62-35]